MGAIGTDVLVNTGGLVNTAAGRAPLAGLRDAGGVPPNVLLARLAVRLVLAAERAVLAQLKPVRIVAPVLPGDVVAVLALLASQCDLGPDVGRSHGGVPFSRFNISGRPGGRSG